MEVTVTPNPTTSNVKILISDGLLQSLAVYTILGKKILTKENINENQFVIPLANYPQGMYIVKVNDRVVKKVIKK
ncbi:T9SS type A sorting domain-containing protein [Tenacibaculum sp. SG-28]|uniref:T9SS type A sorting domain-containing protein n=1 Tax=Tenacibaculum sp. SG-28 TaxID=754426 RepID=UPI001E628F30|nr:T9SS type A sorting domain-containing protein [Tenacibaculum sp. SG-28]